MSDADIVAWFASLTPEYRAAWLTASPPGFHVSKELAATVPQSHNAGAGDMWVIVVYSEWVGGDGLTESWSATGRLAQFLERASAEHS